MALCGGQISLLPLCRVNRVLEPPLRAVKLLAHFLHTRVAHTKCGCIQHILHMSGENPGQQVATLRRRLRRLRSALMRSKNAAPLLGSPGSRLTGVCPALFSAAACSPCATGGLASQYLAARPMRHQQSSPPMACSWAGKHLWNREPEGCPRGVPGDHPPRVDTRVAVSGPPTEMSALQVELPLQVENGAANVKDIALRQLSLMRGALQLAACQLFTSSHSSSSSSCSQKDIDVVSFEKGRGAPSAQRRRAARLSNAARCASAFSSSRSSLRRCNFALRIGDSGLSGAALSAQRWSTTAAS